MVVHHGLARWRRFTAIAFALYAVFLLTSQFEHHDLACELKTPLHCTSCASSQVGADPHVPVTLDSSRLADAGSPVRPRVLPQSAIVTSPSAGRSPPARA